MLEILREGRRLVAGQCLRIIKILVLSAVMAGTLLYGFTAKANEASLLVREIPRLRLVESTVDEAINTTLQLYSAANPDALGILGLKGIIVKVAAGNPTRITMDLKNVPLAAAFDAIAEAGLLTWHLRDDTVTFTAIAIADNAIATEVLTFNAKIRKAFGLSGMTSDEELKRVLEQLKIPEKLVQKVAENKEKDRIVLQGTWTALNEIKCVFALIDRGVSINAAKQ